MDLAPLHFVFDEGLNPRITGQGASPKRKTSALGVHPNQPSLLSTGNLLKGFISSGLTVAAGQSTLSSGLLGQARASCHSRGCL